MVDYIRSDLEFILKQIKIAEAHAAGTPLFGPGGLIPAYNVAWGLRTVDGSYNHLLPGQEYWGSSDQEFKELVPAEYRTVTVMMDPDGPAGPSGPVPIAMPYTPGYDVDGPGTFADPGDVIDPTVRTASNLIVDQTLSNPAAIITSLTRNEVAGNLLAIAASIKAEYELIDHLFKAVDDALDAYSEAQAAADANPGDVALQDSAAAALVAYEAAQTALTEARGPLDALLTANGVEIDGANVVLPNVAPDEGLSAPFNSWFTLFGQFFDHGLDLVNKGGNGSVMIPLQPDDPLWSDEPGALNFMVLTRATTSPGADGILGDNPATPQDESADDGRPVNTTTPFVDQNQTYTSHPSHQVFLRQYVSTPGGPAATGHLIEGVNSGMANWGELKAQTADILGFRLLDSDVGSVPLLLTDPYGNFIPGPNGFPQVVLTVGPDGTPLTWLEGDPTANGGEGVSLIGTARTTMAFLADIAHNAVPDGLADGDIEIGLGNQDGSPATDAEYDNELLDRHFIAGDGRVNENIGLTAVHHVFHAEHNRLAEHTKEVAVSDAQAMLVNGASQAEAVAFLNEWLAVDVANVPTTVAEVNALVWDGNRVFQAAKFGTEMQYQHLVFEEFARKIQPSINTFLVPDGFDTTMDPTIFAEFAHTVYRFGHSMLTESIDRFDTNFANDHIGLIQGFLNPIEFDANGTLDHGVVAGDIIRGMTRQTGNHIDEFVTSALRNNLLGLPLDLATINLARGRDTGVPTLQDARRSFYAAADQNGLLKPYASWIEFAENLKNEASIINFIAAYGTHSLITGQTTIEGKRDAALTIITGSSVGGLALPSDAADFLNGIGAYGPANGLGGLDDIDLWIGGLAEKTMPFGGMLGSTFQFVFEQQMENLQSGDRFYYLQRLDGLHLFGEMEANSFAAMIMRNTNARHLPSDVFAAPGLILEVDPSRQFNDLDGDGTLEGGDPVGGGLLSQLVSRNNPATVGVTDSNYLKYNGGEHVVLGGTDSADIMIGGIGDDTLHGDAGNDRLDGGHGNDIINGGAGHDIIVELGGDDNIKGGEGNDAIHAGPGLDLVLGGAGKDFIVLGTDEGSEVFGGTGDDFILGNKNAERILGNEGNDWLETGTFDGAPGDNFDEIFAHDGIDGNDVFLGDGGFDEFIGEGGDDIMVGSPGRGKMAGMSGFDWATYKASTAGVVADLSIPIIFDEAPTIPGNAALDEYESMEGLSGSQFDDILRGSNDGALGMAPTTVGGSGGYLGSALDAQGIALISGLQGVLGAGVNSLTDGDIILGGDGSDLIAGQAGNDVIDGDKWLNVRISVRANTDGTGAELSTANSMRDLTAQVFAGTINPGQLVIVREILDLTAAQRLGDVDTVVYSDLRANYDIVNNGDGSYNIIHARGTQVDGTDRVRNVELMQFSDMTIGFNAAATGAPVLSDNTPTEGFLITGNTSGIADANGLGPFSYQWQSSANGTTWADIAGATAANFTPQDLPSIFSGAQAGLQLRLQVSFTDLGGTTETVTSAATGPVGLNWDGLLGAAFNGNAGDDIADGGNIGETLNGNAGADDLDGGGGNDTITGGAGNDLISGGAGTDVAAFVGGVADYDVTAAGNTLTVTHARGAATEGTDTVSNVETLRFNGVSYGVVVGNGSGQTHNGGAGNQFIFALNGNDTLNGGAGDDRLFGGGGSDTINQATNVPGRDFVDGGAGADTYVLNGNNGNEAFQILTQAAAVGAGLAVINNSTEIVITRNGVVIAELDNIEEITVNALQATANNGNSVVDGGTSVGDTITVVGNFATTSLNYSTITVNGGRGTDVVDISGLTSDHRVVFNTNDQLDSLIGASRPQDVVNSLSSSVEGGSASGIGSGFGGARGGGGEFLFDRWMSSAAHNMLLAKQSEGYVPMWDSKSDVISHLRTTGPHVGLGHLVWSEYEEDHSRGFDFGMSHRLNIVEVMY